MKLDIFDTKGKSVGKITLDDGIFGIEPNNTALSQYIRVFKANQRHGTSSVKTRSEVSGGGKKPWRQKGTGRARAGSIRSPLWRHGGITHGPKPKSWNLSINKKLRRLALFSILSKKASNNKITVLNELKMKNPKTSELVEILKTLKIDTRRTLLVLAENDLNVRKSASNIKGFNTSLVSNLNAYELVLADTVILLKGAVEKIQEKYASR